MCYHVPMANTFYAVSTGPADRRFLTQEADKALRKCRTIFYPVTKSASNPHAAFDCIQDIVQSSEAECKCINFSMTGDTYRTKSEYEDAASQIVHALEKGNAAFISIGDVSIYSTAARIAGIIEKTGFDTKFISGVPSFCAAACSLKLDLAQDNEEIRIIPGDAYYKKGNLCETLEKEGTKVIMKSSRYIREIIDIIKKKNLINNAFLVHRAGYKDESVFRAEEILHIPEDILNNAYMSIIYLIS